MRDIPVMFAVTKRLAAMFTSADVFVTARNDARLKTFNVPYRFEVPFTNKFDVSGAPPVDLKVLANTSRYGIYSTKRPDFNYISLGAAGIRSGSGSRVGSWGSAFVPGAGTLLKYM